MSIEFTNKPTTYQNQEKQLSFNDVFGDVSKPDSEPAKYDTTQPLVHLFHFHSPPAHQVQPTEQVQSAEHVHSTEPDLFHFQAPQAALELFHFMGQPEKSSSADAKEEKSAAKQEKSTTKKPGDGSLTERIVASISSHEGGFTSINQNDAGYGISVGIRQWNQKTGELPHLIRAWHDKHPTKFKQIFGNYTPSLLNEKWVRDYDMANDSQFMKAMQNALADKDLQRVQLEDAHRFVNNTTELAKKYGFQSEFGVALVCDMVNQMGANGTERALAKCGIKKHEGAIEDEHDAALRISRVRPDGKRFHNLLAQRFSPVLPGVTLA